MNISNSLLEWYDQNSRILPWRKTKDPYHVWLSEIMLQQTRVETVIGYYYRFLDAFPDVHALARADEDTVLKLWEGLGYYSRARNLHAAAKRISADGGIFPNSVEDLEKLPGIGPYASRAIASICFRACVPALDGNQMRILSRCFAIDRMLKSPFDLTKEALDCINRDRPGDYNQALMDLGSGICTARSPKCDICPLTDMCQACKQGDPERYPIRPAKTSKAEEMRTVFIVLTPGGVCIRKRPGKGLLAGLYEFPSTEGHLDIEQARTELHGLGFSSAHDIHSLPPARHVFTHKIWLMNGFIARSDIVADGFQPADRTFLHEHAFPTALRVYYDIADKAMSRD